ncbi:MAG: metallophosphoesterase [Acidobacteria bacterium]|nr:metallophosphoesterase [Acidobacteriota bacterium]
MRIAALYDIHGNLPALEAVLDEVAELGVDRLVVGGDVVPGAFAVECLERLLSSPVPVEFIYGNGETGTLAYLAGETLDAIPAAAHDAVAWVGDRLPPEHAERYAAWPLTLDIDVAGLGRVIFCHATPRNEVEVFTAHTPEERVAPVLSGVSADVVVCGHTHMQFDRTVAKTRLINAGSVGMPFGECGAFWLLVDGASEALELRRTPYDYAAAEQAIQETGFPAPELFALVTPPPEETILERFAAVAI